MMPAQIFGKRETDDLKTSVKLVLTPPPTINSEKSNSGNWSESIYPPHIYQKFDPAS